MPLINETYTILSKFGDCSVFFDDIKLAINLLIQGDSVASKVILGKYIKFTVLDDNLGY